MYHVSKAVLPPENWIFPRLVSTQTSNARGCIIWPHRALQL